MTQTEFSAAEAAAHIMDTLDPHRKRQVMAFVAERYGFNLQPSPKKIVAKPSHENRSEFAAMEEIADCLDGLTSMQLSQAIATLAARYDATVKASYKPPSKGYAPRRKKSM